jgi:hypothetical protein
MPAASVMQGWVDDGCVWAQQQRTSTHRDTLSTPFNFSLLHYTQDIKSSNPFCSKSWNITKIGCHRMTMALKALIECAVFCSNWLTRDGAKELAHLLKEDPHPPCKCCTWVPTGCGTMGPCTWRRLCLHTTKTSHSMYNVCPNTVTPVFERPNTLFNYREVWMVKLVL